MAWYWVAIIGGVLVPWIVKPKMLLAAFGRGIRAGLGAWSGFCVGTILLMLLIMWIAQALQRWTAL